MTENEQAAFVEAYSRNVAMVGDSDVAKFVGRYARDEELEYSGDYTSIMDALGMWNEGAKWALENLAD